MQRGFTLVEMIVVISIVLMMAAGTVPLMQYALQGQPVNYAASALSDMANKARNYAITNQCYTWLAIYQDTANEGVRVTIASSGSTLTGTPKLVSNPVFLREVAMKNRSDLGNLTFSGNPAPTANDTPDDISKSGDAGAFSALSLNVSGKTVVFDRLIVFTPRGEAITKQDSSSNPVYSRWIQVALVNQHGSTTNAALLQIGGISPQCTVYRP